MEAERAKAEIFEGKDKRKYRARYRKRVKFRLVKGAKAD